MSQGLELELYDHKGGNSFLEEANRELSSPFFQKEFLQNGIRLSLLDYFYSDKMQDLGSIVIRYQDRPVLLLPIVELDHDLSYLVPSSRMAAVYALTKFSAQLFTPKIFCLVNMDNMFLRESEKVEFSSDLISAAWQMVFDAANSIYAEQCKIQKISMIAFCNLTKDALLVLNPIEYRKYRLLSTQEFCAGLVPPNSPFKKAQRAAIFRHNNWLVHASLKTNLLAEGFIERASYAKT